MRRVRQDDVVTQPGQQHRGRGRGGHGHNVIMDQHETSFRKVRPTALAES
jgi:hypothetical protein